jgi:hypothetical protein
MKLIVFVLIGVAALAAVVAATAPTTGPGAGAAAAISEGKLPRDTATGG